MGDVIAPQEAGACKRAFAGVGAFFLTTAIKNEKIFI
jgi:hypothetical protein